MEVTIDGITQATFNLIVSRLGEEIVSSTEIYRDQDDNELYTLRFIRASVKVRTYDNEVVLSTHDEMIRLSRFAYSQIILY